MNMVSVADGICKKVKNINNKDTTVTLTSVAPTLVVGCNQWRRKPMSACNLESLSPSRWLATTWGSKHLIAPTATTPHPLYSSFFPRAVPIFFWHLPDIVSVWYFICVKLFYVMWLKSSFHYRNIYFMLILFSITFLYWMMIKLLNIDFFIFKRETSFINVIKLIKSLYCHYNVYFIHTYIIAQNFTNF